MLPALAASLRAEARAANERRLLVLAGSRTAGYERVADALAGADIDRAATTVVSRRTPIECERLSPDRAGELLGTTRTAVVLDCHDIARPNALGQTVGAVDGGGLFVLVCPPLDEWPARRDDFDERLVVAPHVSSDVTGNFRRRLVETIRAHRGVAIVDVDAGVVECDGLAGATTGEDAGDRAATTAADVTAPSNATFPPAAYQSCLTADQADAVAALECLRDPGHAVVLEADRGRGKSSAAGIAAGALAAAGRDVLVTAPAYRGAREVFVRASALLDAVGAEYRVDESPPRRIEAGDGAVRFAGPLAAVDRPGDPDVMVVDEAAALPVHLLTQFLHAPSVAFASTVHGYEGAGRGFSVKFRDRLTASDRAVEEIRLETPVRYAAGDPVETWAFRALLLDARPAVDDAVASASPETASYTRLEPAELLADEPLLREVFGLLVLAHYRTEPDDLARLLDAPNLSTRALIADGRVVAVALLAAEGDLPAETRRRMMTGERVRGHMVPDLLVAQLRDEAAASPSGVRVVRIATHPAVHRRGLATKLLSDIATEYDAVDWLGTGFGATPDLLAFWRANGYRVVHLGTTRNETSGEYSALMLRPVSEAGRTLHDRHAKRFAGRVEAMLSDPLRDADPDVIRAALRATEAPVDLALTPHEWTLVASAAAGPAHLEVDPGPFRLLAVKHLVDPTDATALSADAERLLVARVLQARQASGVAKTFGYPSGRQVMRAVGDAYATLVDMYGPAAARETLDRHD